MAIAAPNTSQGRYAQHRPEQTLLYGLIAEHLETFLDEARSHHERPLPKYVERDLRAYLACGIHAHGFLRARCRECGKDLLVAFSCKKRGVCPSCNARRMCATAAHLTDRVFPDVPVRRWVLSVPFELRLLLARNHRALSAVGRIFVREVFHWQRERGALAGISGSRCGAVCFPQRFGGSLNLNVHYHVAVPDGVFTRGTGERAGFFGLARPTHDDLDTIALNVEMRVRAWLARRGLLVDQARDSDGAQRERSALDACLEASLGVGELASLPEQACSPDDAIGSPTPAKSGRRAGRSSGFDVHAGVFVSASDREGRERLLRYCARPALSLERLSGLPDGRVAYELRKPWGKQTHRVMQPVQFLARLAALVPPPRRPLVRFHGVLAPHSAWRSRVVPGPGGKQQQDDVASCKQDGRQSSAKGRGAGAALAKTRHRSDTISEAATGATDNERFTFGRIDWATLLKRIYDVDALACPCGGRLRFIALIDDADVAGKILASLGLPSIPPPVARARSPNLVEPSP